MKTRKPRPQFDIFKDRELVDNCIFQKYHIQNPEVYSKFKGLTLEAIKKGFKHFSARGIFEVMRFSTPIKDKDSGFQYNNNHTPYYVRMFILEFPEHTNFFKLRKTKYSA